MPPATQNQQEETGMKREEMIERMKQMREEFIESIEESTTDETIERVVCDIDDIVDALKENW